MFDPKRRAVIGDGLYTVVDLIVPFLLICIRRELL
jgi:hypothetical protein